MTDSKNNIYDVIIIGAGSTGTPLAYYLSKAGKKVLVLEKAASVGQGSNKKAIGGIRATHSDPAKIQLCLESLRIFSTWEEEHGDDIEWTQGGYCFVAYREQEKKVIQDLLIKQKAYGLNIDWLDRNTLLEKVSDLNPENLLGGSFAPEDGSASPLLAAHAFYDHARKHGAEFHFNETVSNILTKGEKVTGVQTSKDTYTCEIIVNAAGAWAKEIGKMANIDLPVNPDAHEAAVTEPVEHFLDPMIVDIQPVSGSSNFYFYQHETGQIFFCITPQPNIWGFNTEETSTFLPMVSKRIVAIMPRLKSIRVRRTWRGLYPMTPDGFPIIGWSNEVQGFLQAVGMCGQGFMLGPGVGKLITRIIQDECTQEDEVILNYVSPYRNFNRVEMLQ